MSDAIIREGAMFLADFHRLPVFQATGLTEDGVCLCYNGANCGRPGKHPRFSGWQAKSKSEHSATTDRQTIERYFSPMTTFRIGVETGTGVVVFDGDTVGALDQLGPVPETLTVLTRRGKQMYFRTGATDGEFHGSVGLLPKVDVRAYGNLVIAPPSSFPGGHYTFVDPFTSIAPLPDNLKSLLREHTTSTRFKLPRPSPEAYCTIAGEQPWARQWLKGNEGIERLSDPNLRNRNLFKVTCYALELIARGDLAPSATDDIKAASALAGLSDNEIDATMASAARSVFEMLAPSTSTPPQK